MKTVPLFLYAGILLFFSSCDLSPSEINFHSSHEPKRQNTPFSDAVETDDLFFLAGQIGRDHDKGFLVEGGIKAETKQAIENIKAVLEHHGLDLDRVVKCTVILSDIKDFSDFNEVYMQYFPNRPARTTFAASGLAASAKIEIDVIAAK
ncbi:MAG: RidA family protein [Flavobacteriaceae bacterium]|nr:RidA family protein [Bacteroidia bacterium]NNK87424.1 RidA family protein [Flavobacteriaceae bacterium]